MMDRELRRYQNLLACVGTGVVTFGIWSVIKAVMTYARDKDSLMEFLRAYLGPQYADAVFWILLAFIGAFVVVDLILRLGVGMAARKDGMGERKKTKKHRVYLVAAFVLVIVTVFSMLSNFSDMATLNELSAYLDLNNGQVIGPFVDAIFEVVVKTIVDITSMIMIIEMIVAGIKVSGLEKKIREAGAEEVAS